MTDAPPPKKDPKDYRFQPGNPGKPKGVRHKLKESFFKDVTDFWAAKGKVALDEAYAKDPLGFVKMVASVLPHQIDVKVASKSMSDEELIAIIREGATNPDADDAAEGPVH